MTRVFRTQQREHLVEHSEVFERLGCVALAALAALVIDYVLSKATQPLRRFVHRHDQTLTRSIGLVELVEERRKGNCTERMLRATAASYVISPSVLAAVEPDPERSPDQLSARWLLAVAARLVRDVGELITGAARARKRLATFAIGGEVRFASAADRAAFAEELVGAVTSLVSKYHDESAAAGRAHRIVVAVHPTVQREERG